ncbi:MAG TPA: DUF5658 family protein [Pirellulales bacterium]|jgi:hypothetical protein|nr:DUF5658 family protein [Pirellulales bacterium]
MKTTPDADRRAGPDPRQTPTSIWDTLACAGERIWNRRAADRLYPYFVDRFPPATLVSIVLLLALTILDGVLTLHLVEVHCRELNPLMGYLLERGPMPFLLGKYVLTAAGLPVLLIFKHFRLFGTHFRVGYLIGVFLLLYACLITYQILLLHQLK